MDRDTFYQQAAAEAERQAARTVSADELEAWLRIAEGWRALLRKRPQTPEGSVVDAGGDDNKHDL